MDGCRGRSDQGERPRAPCLLSSRRAEGEGGREGPPQGASKREGRRTRRSWGDLGNSNHRPIPAQYNTGHRFTKLMLTPGCDGRKRHRAGQCAWPATTECAIRAHLPRHGRKYRCAEVKLRASKEDEKLRSMYQGPSGSNGSQFQRQCVRLAQVSNYDNND